MIWLQVILHIVVHQCILWQLLKVLQLLGRLTLGWILRGSQVPCLLSLPILLFHVYYNEILLMFILKGAIAADTIRFALFTLSLILIL